MASAPKPLRWLLVACSALLLSGCMTSRTIDESRKLQATGQTEAALELLATAMRERPGDETVRTAYYRLREQLVTQALTRAEVARHANSLEDAEREARTALRIEPLHPRAQALLIDIEAQRRRQKQLAQAEEYLGRKNFGAAEMIARNLLAEAPGDGAIRALVRKLDEQRAATQQQTAPDLQGPFSKPITLEFRDAPLRTVFEAISRTAGINFVFDKDVRADTRVSVFVRNTSIDEVIRLVLQTNQLDRKVLNSNSVLVYPSSAAKQREYQELVTRTFFLANTDAKQAQALIKQVVKTRDVFIDEKLNVMVIKDTPDAVRLAERLVQTLDVADPEVMLEVEVMEVSRNKLTELGLRFPDQLSYGAVRSQFTTVQKQTGDGIVSEVVPLPGSEVAPGVIPSRLWDNLTVYASNPLLTLNLKAQDSDSNILANPRIRVRNREKARIHIGEKLPVFTTTSTANVGVSAAVNYLDVGLKLDVEPTIRLTDEVEIKVGLEVSSVVKEVMGPQNSLAYQVGTRNTNTVLRLRDGETQILAGLISDEERSSANRLPGFGHIPGVGKLFSSERDSGSKTEIVLLITPRVLRNILPPQLAQASLASGTEAAVGAAPLVIAPTASRSLDVRGAGNAVPAAAGAVTNPRAPAPASGEAPRAVSSASGPANVRAGQEFTVNISVRANVPLDEGELIVRYDESLFDLQGEGPTLPLRTAGNNGSLQLRLKAKDGAKGEGSVGVDGGTVTSQGSAVPVEVGTPLAVRVDTGATE